MKRYNTGGVVQLTGASRKWDTLTAWGPSSLPRAHCMVASDGSHAAEGTAAGLQGPLQCCGKAMGWWAVTLSRPCLLSDLQKIQTSRGCS